MIRPAERADIPAIWELIQELAEFERLSHAVTGSVNDLERHVIDEARCIVFVCDDEGEIVGYTLSFPIYSTFRTRPGMWLEDLYVTPAKRGCGLGKALLANLVDHCETFGLGRLEWSVLDWNESAIRFYESMGADVMPDWRICRISFP